MRQALAGPPSRPVVRPPGTASSRLAPLGLGLLGVAAILLAGSVEKSSEPTHAVVWGSLALAAYAGGLLITIAPSRQAAFGLGLWKLGSWTLASYGVTFGLATISWSQRQTGTPAQIALPSILKALWLIAVALTLWTAGYTAGPGRPLRCWAARGLAALDRRVTEQVRSPATPWLLYGLSLAARGVTVITTGRFGYVGDASSAVDVATSYGQILAELALCAPLAVATASLQVFREGLRGARITLVVLFVMELTLGAAAGGKQNFIVDVLAVLIPLTASRRRVPKSAIAVVGIFFLIVIIPFNEAYRAEARGGSVNLTPVEAIRAAPEILQSAVFNRQIIMAIPDTISYLTQRIREIDSPAIILQRTPGQIGFLSPAVLAVAPVTGIIPRALWPGKPIMATGYMFSQQYYGLSHAQYTSSAITPPGDLYRHGGWAPLMIGMFMLGCGVRLLDDTLDVRASPHAGLLILMLFPILVKGENDWVALLSSIPGTVAIWALAVRLAFRPRR